MIRLNIYENGLVECPFDENKPFIEVTEEQLAKIQSGQLKYKNGELVDNTSNINAMARIKELKQQLTDTDYKAIKYAEGLITDEEYEPIKSQRQAWRDEINELEKEVE